MRVFHVEMKEDKILTCVKSELLLQFSAPIGITNWKYAKEWAVLVKIDAKNEKSLKWS